MTQPTAARVQPSLHLPSIVASALAANNEGQTHLRWKAVIHHMPATAATANSPDFAAAKWLRHQMAYKGKHSPTSAQAGVCLLLSNQQLTNAAVRLETAPTLEFRLQHNLTLLILPA